MSWDKFFRCYVGDCVDLMRQMPEKAFHTCVTNPPYFGLRDYGVEGQIGLEPTPEEFIQRLVEVFREGSPMRYPGGSGRLARRMRSMAVGRMRQTEELKRTLGRFQSRLKECVR
ncbi:hypothetical protein GCM10022405_18540 [Gibbsiella dentisursi]|uniref:Site-specific DNA-methyltransferase (adenine-specific) n=1 Tax=Gibbsiella dentisursi TaxID=796890 RepID=A0ABP7L328_9GAMM